MTASPASIASPVPIPQTPGWPLLGSALDIARNPVRYLVQQYQELGPVFRVRAAHMDMVVLAGPEANEFVHEGGKACFSNGQNWGPALAEFGAPNTFVGLDGDVHWTLRKRLAAQFSRATAERHLDDFVGMTLDAFDQAGAGTDLPFVEFGKRLASRQIGSSLIGRVPTPEEHSAILRYTNTALVHLSLRRLPRWLLFMHGPGFYRDKKLAMRFGRDAVREHLARPDREPNFIDAIVEAHADLPGLLDEAAMPTNGMLPFFAGVDTVGQTIGFLMYEVLRSPETFARVRREADAVFADGALDPKVLRKSPDIQGAVMEVLRLHPVAFAMPRHAACDFEFRGHHIEKGQALLVFTAACHFLDEHFADAERFDIDRYRAPRNEQSRPNVHAPWGRGPHQCLGSGLAGFQLASTLATIVHHCDVELPDPNRTFEPILDPSLSIGPEFSVRFNGRRRLKRS